MKKEIKFRAWDTKLKRMHKGGFWIGSDYGQVFLCERVEPIEIKVDIDLIPLQYTGLKDKNRKEIYEGDIVKYKFMSGFDCGWEDGEGWDKTSNTIEEHTKEVVFNNGEFYPKETATIVEDGYYSYRLFDVEIIGNIYENPELLTKI